MSGPLFVCVLVMLALLPFLAEGGRDEPEDDYRPFDWERDA